MLNGHNRHQPDADKYPSHVPSCPRLGQVWGNTVAPDSRTCARGPCLAITRQQTSTLRDDQIAPGNAEFQRLRVGVDDA